MSLIHTISDYIYFDLKTIQGHIYVSFIEIILQVFIYNIAISKISQDGYVSPSRSIAVFSIKYACCIVQGPFVGDLS